MTWLSLLIQGFRIASVFVDMFAKLQAKREALEQHNLMNDSANLQLIREYRVLEDEWRTMTDPVKLRAKLESDVSGIEKRVLGADSGTVISDVFGTGTTAK